MGMTELCKELKNWFETKKYLGRISLKNGSLNFLDSDFSLLDGQYFRLIGSVFSDGVHVYGNLSDLKDEDFFGSVWAMAVPPSVIALSEEIDSWLDKYGGADSVVNSPFQSESFGGYSYNKASGTSGSGSGSGNAWRSIFAKEINKWRKI